MEEIKEREIWIITFADGTEFASFTEDDIEEQFGQNGPDNEYVVVKGVWRPVE